MKKICFISALMLMVLVQGCDKFLDLKPQNTRVVSTIEDYRDLLASYMRLLKEPDAPQQPVLGSTFVYPLFNIASDCAYRSGELTLNKENTSNYDTKLGEFKTNAVKTMTWIDAANSAWTRYYSFLGPISLIIGGIETADGDDEQLRDYVKGEALIWRAYAYFKLLQYYAPYKENKYGIPVYLKPYEDPGNAMPERKTQTDVYKQIFTDCNEALTLLERTKTTRWNCAYNEQFLHAMLASIYCWKALGGATETTDWENALAHAEKALKGRTFARDPAVFKAMFSIENMQRFTNDEFNLRIADSENQVVDVASIYYQPGTKPMANPGPDVDFYALFKEDDVRKAVYFKPKADGSVYFDKYNFSNVPSYQRHGGVVMPFRTAETQLIKAEALQRLGREGEAKTALEQFKQGRYLDIADSYTESDLLKEILKERKLEFYHEQDFWWLDMKRTSTRVQRNINGDSYVLEPDDFRYAFPIPLSEMKVNKKMVQNPGWDEILF